MAKITAFSDKLYLSIYISVYNDFTKNRLQSLLRASNCNTPFSKVIASKEIPLSFPFRASRYLWFKILINESLRI